MGNARSAVTADVLLGARVRMRRRQAGLTQGELAGRLGITFQQVQKYEKGVNRISACRLAEIAGVLGTPIGAFYEGLAPGGDGDGPLVRALATSEGLAMLSAWDGIASADVRRRVVALVEALSDGV